MSEFVEEFKIGNTNVKIADDYCRDKTPGNKIKDVIFLIL